MRLALRSRLSLPQTWPGLSVIWSDPSRSIRVDLTSFAVFVWCSRHVKVKRLPLANRGRSASWEPGNGKTLSTRQIAIVTGASRGIGAASAEWLAGQGAHVVAVARTTGGLEELDDRIQAAGGQADACADGHSRRGRHAASLRFGPSGDGAAPISGPTRAFHATALTPAPTRSPKKTSMPISPQIFEGWRASWR